MSELIKKQEMSEEDIKLQYITPAIKGDDAVTELVSEDFAPKYGARPLRRAIQNQVEDAVAERMLEGSLKEGGTARLAVADGKLTVEAEAQPEAKAEEPQPAEAK